MGILFKGILTVIMVGLSGNFAAHAASPDVGRLEKALQTHITHGQAVGLVVGILDDSGRQIITMGKSDRLNGLPVDENSIFEIGSVTKTFTGILLAEMVIRGEVGLDDPAAQYLPENVTLPGRDGQQITLRHLATHTSGLPGMPDNFKPVYATNPYADYTVQDMYDFLSGYTLTRDIGTVAEYSNIGMGLLGHILARKARLPYEDLVKQYILRPLGMKDTTITISPAQKPHFTTGHDPAGEPASHWDIPTFAGAGAFRSTGKDMMTYLAANMAVTVTSLSPAIEMSHRFQHEFGSKDMYIGLGWLTGTGTEATVIWHNGGTGGYRTFIGFDKSRQRGVFVLTNSQDDPDKIAMAILKDEIASLVVEPVKTITNAGKFVGDYQLAPNFILYITAEKGRLYAQVTGQGKLPIFVKGYNEFFYKAVNASLSFIEDEAGNISSLILHQNGNHPAKKIR